MQNVLFPFFGGLGLFLVGMMLLSQGLVAFGGHALKQALARFTGTPGKAVLSGTLATAVVQSSSATTVALIGFVSAGLISFHQAIGVLIGASLGNTATGWIVAGLGLKVNLGFYTLPLIGIGALLKLMARGRWAELGLALAGFGMARATAHTKLLNFTSNIASLLFFALGGKVVWSVGFCMALGQFIGARFGSKLVLIKGVKLIKPLLVTVSLLMSAKLVWSQYPELFSWLV